MWGNQSRRARQAGEDGAGPLGSGFQAPGAAAPVARDRLLRGVQHAELFGGLPAAQVDAFRGRCFWVVRGAVAPARGHQPTGDHHRAIPPALGR
jgi:hypothetical protein